MPISRDAENILILPAFGFGPGFDELDQVGAGYAVGELETVRGQLITGGFPFLAGSGGQEFEFVLRQLHGAPSSAYV